MSSILEKYIEICISIFIYIVAAGMTATVLLYTTEPIISEGSDKTFIESSGIQKQYNSELYGSDILLMLLNSDTMIPHPKAIKINNTPVIEVDAAFVGYQISNIALIYSATGDYKLSTMLDYKVVSQEYVYSGPDSPYIHYILEEVK